MENITKEEYKTINEAINYYIEDLVSENDSLFYNVVLQSKRISIQKDEESYLVIKRIKMEEGTEKRDFLLSGVLTKNQVDIVIDEKAEQGQYNYERIRQGNYHIDGNTIIKEYNHDYNIIVDDKKILIDGGSWIEEDSFSKGEKDLISNCKNIAKSKIKRKSLHR